MAEKKIVVGLTGGLASGKSTAARMFEQMGARVLRADDLVHEILRRDRAVIEALCRRFGPSIRHRSGLGVDRRVLAEIVFRQPSARRFVERLLHPRVSRAMRAAVRRFEQSRGPSLLVLEIPLLFETGWDRGVDVIVVVRANQRQQVERAATSLGISKAEALRRIQAQMPTKEKLLCADRILDNRGTRSDLRRRVKRLVKELTAG